jgi:NDP-sugar pyrophosphorylase family protein
MSAGRQAVVLAGGKGTRLSPYTVVFPKPMLRWAANPSSRSPDQLIKRFTDIVISLGYLGDLIELYVKEKAEGATIRSSRTAALGTAGALSLVENPKRIFWSSTGIFSPP